MVKEEQYYLAYVKFVCKNTNKTFEYDFYFTKTPENVWGEDWDYKNPSICNDTTPEKSTYDKIIRVVSVYPFKTIEEMPCYSILNATYGIVALCWIDIENLESYPKIGRCVFHFKDKINDVLEKISNENLFKIKGDI